MSETGGTKEIFIDKDGVQTRITELTSYKNQADSSRTDCTDENKRQNSPADLSSFSTNLGTAAHNLNSQITTLQSRLDAAVAANETGTTFTAADGRISYVAPADANKETTESVNDLNHVATWRQAKEDAATLVSYSENGCSPEEWDALYNRLYANRSDDRYANTITSTIGPGRLLDLPADIQSKLTVYDHKDRTTFSMRPNAGEELASVLGSIFSTASTSETASGVPIWSDDKAREYAKRLVDAAEEDGKPYRINALNQMLLASREEDIDGDGSREAIGLDYNDAFLVELGKQLEEFKPDEAEWYELDDPRYNPRVVPVGPGDNPLTGVVHAMTGNPEAANSWITVTDSKGDVDAAKTTERAANLTNSAGLGDNDWTTDWTKIAAQTALSSTDVPPENSSAQAAITSGILNTIGGSATEVTISAEARNAASIALAQYAYGVQSATNSGPDGTGVMDMEGETWGSDMPYQPKFTNNALTNLIGQIGSHRTAMARVAASQEMLNSIQLSKAAEKGGQSFVDVIDAQNTTRGYITGAIHRQSEIDGANADERIENWANAASIAVSAIPVPAAKAATPVAKTIMEFASSAAKGAAAEGAKNSVNAWGGNAQQQRVNNANAVDTSIATNQALSTVLALRYGLFAPKQLGDAAKEDGPATSKAITLDADAGTATPTPEIDDGSLSQEEIDHLVALSRKLHWSGKTFGARVKEMHSTGYRDSHEVPKDDDQDG